MLSREIDLAWEQQAQLTNVQWEDLRPKLEHCLAELDSGRARIAEKTPQGWSVAESYKKAVLLYIGARTPSLIPGTSAPFWDKVPLKTSNWTEEDFRKAGFRLCPGAIVRFGAYIAPNTVIMPSFVNMGAFIGEGTLIDSWVTVGSCAQVGSRCHISEGAALGGVLEPIQGLPVIVEDDCFIGGRVGIFEGMRVQEGSIIAPGVILSASTRIIDRRTGEISHGVVPAGSLVISGTYETSPGLHISCAIIAKTVNAETRKKVGVNALLRREME